MRRLSFHIDPDQHEQLQIISEVSRGRPKIAALIREAIDHYVAACKASDPAVRARLDPSLKTPRLVRTRAERSGGSDD